MSKNRKLLKPLDVEKIFKRSKAQPTKPTRTPIQKIENSNNKVVYQDCNGVNLYFPEMLEPRAILKGDKIELESETRPTGTTLMPDGTIIKYEDGIVKKVDKTHVEELAKLSAVGRGIANILIPIHEQLKLA